MIKLKQNLYPINQIHVKCSIFNHSDLIHHDKTETKSLSNKSKLRKVFNFYHSDLIHHDKNETKSLSNKSKVRKVFSF